MAAKMHIILVHIILVHLILVHIIKVDMLLKHCHKSWCKPNLEPVRIGLTKTS